MSGARDDESSFAHGGIDLECQPIGVRRTERGPVSRNEPDPEFPSEGKVRGIMDCKILRMSKATRTVIEGIVQTFCPVYIDFRPSVQNCLGGREFRFVASSRRLRSDRTKPI